MENKHEKFKKYWESIGKPELEGTIDGKKWVILINPEWTENNYRIKGDRHWKLRKKWIDSDFALKIESSNDDGEGWMKTVPSWYQDFEYREAIEPPQMYSPASIAVDCFITISAYGKQIKLNHAEAIKVCEELMKVFGY